MDFSDVDGLSSMREVKSIDKGFAETIDAAEKMYDNIILDVNVLYSFSRGRGYVLNLIEDEEITERVIESLGRDLLEEISADKYGGKFDLQFKSTPYSRLKAVDNLVNKVYISDISEDCLNQSTEKMSDIDSLFEYIEERTEELPVKDKLGLDSDEVFSQDNLPDYKLDEEHPSDYEFEDEALVECANELDGDTIILTYDRDFLSKNIPATIPEFIYRT